MASHEPHPVPQDDPIRAELEHAPDAFEAMLSELPVRRPSRALDERIAESLDPPVYALPWVRRVSAVAAVVALTLTAGLVLMTFDAGQGAGTQTTVASNDDSRPAADDTRIEEVWVDAQPTGRLVLADGSALEEVRVTEVRHVSFSEGEAEYELALPIERTAYRAAAFY